MKKYLAPVLHPFKRFFDGKQSEKKTKSIIAHLDERFSQSPETSGFRYIFWTESANGVFYINKEMVGDDPPNEITLTMRFKKERE